MVENVICCMWNVDYGGWRGKESTTRSSKFGEFKSLVYLG